MEHLVLIDGHHMMYRAYWAIPRTLKTSSGEQVNTVFGMASMILSILQQETPDALVVAFDLGDQTFRHLEHDTYKAGRAETPDDFYSQVPRVMQLMEAWQLPVVSDGNFEADDFLGAYAKQAAEKGSRVTIVSGDRDVFQMASDKIRIAIPHKGYQAAEYLGPAEIEAKYGITPTQVASYKGLCGDSSDNLPGVKGIGPKTAATLLQQYGTLAGVYEHIDEIKPVIAEKLRADKDQAFFCERMACLATDIPLPVSLDDTMLGLMPTEQVLGFFSLMEFSLLSRRLVRLLETPFGQRHFMPLQNSALAEPATEAERQLSLFDS